MPKETWRRLAVVLAHWSQEEPPSQVSLRLGQQLPPAVARILTVRGCEGHISVETVSVVVKSREIQLAGRRT